MEINNNRKDWALEKLGDFADYEKGKKPKDQSSKQSDIFKYPYINIKAFEKGIIDTYTDGEKCKFCSEDDFLMVWDGSRFGFVGKGINGVLGSTLMKINFPGIENHFAYYFLKSKYLEINSKPKGTGTPHVNPELLWNYIFPIAPLPEQQAIVSKIEQLFSDLDNGIENFKKAQEQLKRYRQSVLKAACEGKLVPTEAELTRAEGRDYEPADVLLARILKERREKWNGKGKYKEPAAPDTSGLLDLPGGWGWTNVGSTGKVSGGLTKNPKRNKLFQQMPYIRVANVYADKLKLEDIANIGIKESEIERVLLEKGDLLVVEGNGSLDQIGRAALWDGSISPCVHQNHIIKVRFNPTKIGKYILLWLLSKKGRKEITNVASSTSGLYTLSISKVASLFVPFPP